MSARFAETKVTHQGPDREARGKPVSKTLSMVDPGSS